MKAFLEESNKIIPKNNWPKVVFENIPKRFQRSSRKYFQRNCRKNSQINVQKIAGKTSKHLLKKKGCQTCSKQFSSKKFLQKYLLCKAVKNMEATSKEIGKEICVGITEEVQKFQLIVLYNSTKFPCKNRRRFWKNFQINFQSNIR